MSVRVSEPMRGRAEVEAEIGVETEAEAEAGVQAAELERAADLVVVEGLGRGDMGEQSALE